MKEDLFALPICDLMKIPVFFRISFIPIKACTIGNELFHAIAWLYRSVKNFIVCILS